MLNTLLESDAKRERSATGTIASAAAHTVMIGAALYATAQAHVEITKSVQMVQPVYFAPLKPAAAPRANPGVVRAIAGRPAVFVAPDIKASLPPIEMASPIVGPDDFRGGPAAVWSVGGQSPGSGDAVATFRADQVEKPVWLISGSASPKYPEVLRVAGVEGHVIARFVVDEVGRVEERTIRFVRSDNPLFDEAVRAALGRMRFAPAEIAGKKVRQLVEMPFVFALSR
jgi:protein TonB